MIGKLNSMLFCFFYALLNVSGASIIKCQIIGQTLDSLELLINFLLKSIGISASVVIFSLLL
jgi:hypothetical protein